MVNMFTHFSCFLERSEWFAHFAHCVLSKWAIHSFSHFVLSKWAIYSILLILFWANEWFAHFAHFVLIEWEIRSFCSFFWSNLSKWANEGWANEQWANEWIPNPAVWAAMCSRLGIKHLITSATIHSQMVWLRGSIGSWSTHWGPAWQWSTGRHICLGSCWASDQPLRKTIMFQQPRSFTVYLWPYQGSCWQMRSHRPPTSWNN